MKTNKPNKAKIIFEDNNYPYFQDYTFFRGIPQGILFDIESWEKSSAQLVFTAASGADIAYKLNIEQGTVWLSAPGYGGEPYGNGRIAIKPSSIFECSTIL